MEDTVQEVNELAASQQIEVPAKKKRESRNVDPITKQARKREKERIWRETNADKVRQYRENAKARRDKIKEEKAAAIKTSEEEEAAKQRRAKLAAIQRQRRAAAKYYEEHKEELKAKNRERYHAKREGLPKGRPGPKPKKADVDYVATMNTIEIKLNESTNELPGGALPSGDDENDLIFEEIADKLGNL